MMMPGYVLAGLPLLICLVHHISCGHALRLPDRISGAPAAGAAAAAGHVLLPATQHLDHATSTEQASRDKNDLQQPQQRTASPAHLRRALSASTSERHLPPPPKLLNQVRTTAAPKASPPRRQLPTLPPPPPPPRPLHAVGATAAPVSAPGSQRASPKQRQLPSLPPPPPPPRPPGQVESPSPPPPVPSAVSQLWGDNGELYTPQGSLVDIAWAGYQQGNAVPPRPPITFDLKRDFHAIGDGDADDSDAFQNALNRTPTGGVLYIPAGTYKLTKPASLNDSAIIIRGAGVGVTILYYTKSFADIWPSQYSVNVLPSPFNSGPFFLTFSSKNSKWMTAKDGRHYLADITRPASRGDYLVTVSTTKRMKVGQWLQLLAFDANLTLATYMYGGYVDKDDSLMENAPEPLIRHLTTVAEVISPTVIRVTRPLPFDFRSQWVQQIVVAWNVDAGTDGAGIEDMTVRFPGTDYPGHLRERGFNWLSYWSHHNIFIRNIRILNADFGIAVNADFGLVENITFDTDYDRTHWSPKKTEGMSGHHAIALNRARGVLVRNFRINTKFVHDLSVLTLSSDNVFKDGSGLDLSIDYHKQPMHGNLWQRLDCGNCSRLYNYSGGSPGYGLQAGMYNTFWGIYSGVNARFGSCLPGNDFGANLNFVGLGCNPVVQSDVPYAPIGWTMEHINPHALHPRDLYQAMRDANINPLFPNGQR